MRTTTVPGNNAEIKVVEPPRVRHLLIYYFLQGLGLSLFFVVANSMFLQSFVAADLPGAYLVSAVVMLVLGRVYDMVEQRVAMYKRASLLILMALSVFALFAASQVSASTLVPFLMFVWYRVLFTISDLEFWGLSNLFFDTRESKSLFGWINMREAPAKVVGYFSVGLLLQVVELPMLLAISGVAFLVNYFVARKLLDPAYAKEERVVASKPEKASLLRFEGRKLLVLLCLISFIIVVIFTIVNFSFLSLLEDREHSVKELATLLSVVFGIASLLVVVGKTVLTNKNMARLGAMASMVSLPLFLIVTCALLFAKNDILEERFLTYYMILIAGGRLFREAFFAPVFVSLAQPLPNHIRQRSYTFVKTIAEPLGIALAAVIIYYVLRRTALPDLNTGTLIIMGAAALLVLLALLAFRIYVSVFKLAIANKTLVTRAIDSFNSYSQDIIRQKLESRLPEEVIYAHQLCSEANTHFFEMEPGRLLRHDSAAVRLYALNQMSVDTPFSDTDILIYLGLHDPSLEVRQAAIEHLGARYNERFADEYNNLLEHLDLKLREAALRGLMESGNPEIIMIAGQKLNDLINSDDAQLNMIGASIIGDIKLHSHFKYLQKFFHHKDIAVRKAAILAAGKLARPELMQEIFSLIGDESQSGEVVQALAMYKNVAVNYLLEHKEIIEKHPDAILEYCSYVDERIASKLICEYLLPQAEAAMLDHCLGTLNTINVESGEVDRGVVELKLVATGTFIYNCLYYMDGLGPDAAVLADALEVEVKNAKRRLLLLLSLLYNRKDLARVIAVWDEGGDNAKFLKALDTVLDDSHKKRFRPIFELTDLGALKNFLSQFYPAPAQADVSDVVLTGPKNNRFLMWTQAAALYTNLLFLSDEVLQLYKDHQESMIAQMANLALSRQPFVLRMVGDDTSGNFHTDDANPDPLLQIERIQVLKTIPIFETYSQEMLSAISAMMQEQRFKPNELVYGEGEPGDYMFIIYYGNISMFNGVQEIMQQGSKEVFVKIDSPDQKLASARANAETLLFRIKGEDIEALRDKHPVMVRRMLTLFTTI